MIAIVDYGVGNIKNVEYWMKNISEDVFITKDKDIISKASLIILPGVGAFRDAINELRKTGLDQLIVDEVNKGKLLLGICLGMQLLFDISYENGTYKGLGLLKGKIKKLDEGLKVPHMGWNSLEINREDDLMNTIKDSRTAYFVHSYYLEPEDEKDVVAYANYGVKVPAIVRKDNVIGMQFHPEKSGETGMKLLENIKELIR